MSIQDALRQMHTEAFELLEAAVESYDAASALVDCAEQVAEAAWTLDALEQALPPVERARLRAASRRYAAAQDRIGLLGRDEPDSHDPEGDNHP